MAMTSGAWRQLDQERYKAANRSGYRPPEVEDVDVDGYRVRQIQQRIRGITFELTHKPALVKTRERQFTNDLTEALLAALAK